METQDQSIKVSIKTKIKFDKLQFDYRVKGNRKTQDEMIEMLININKEFNKIYPKYTELLKESKLREKQWKIK